MSTEEISERVLKLLFHAGYPYQMAMEGIFDKHLPFKVPSEQQKQVKAFLLNATGLCETVEEMAMMHVIKLSKFGYKVMDKHGSYSNFLEHQKQEEIQKKLEQEQQAEIEAEKDKRAKEQMALEEQRAHAQELREMQRDADNNQKDKKESHRSKVATYLSVTGILVAVVLGYLEYNQSDNNTKETIHKVETKQQDGHAKPSPTNLDKTAADSIKMTVKTDSVPSDSIKGKQSL